MFSQQRQYSCLVSSDTSGFFSSRGRAVGTLLEVRRETQVPFPVATGILEFLSIFKRSQAMSPVEVCNSAFLLKCQRGLKPPVVMRRGIRALSRVSTGDSDIPSCWERKHECACESLQGNKTFSWSEGNSVSIPLEAPTQGPSHIPIAERSLLLRCLWKVGIPLESKSGNQL